MGELESDVNKHNVLMLFLVQDAPRPTYNFSSGWAPDAMFIDLGTNDVRAINLRPSGPAEFVAETVAFMKNATVGVAMWF